MGSRPRTRSDRSAAPGTSKAGSRSAREQVELEIGWLDDEGAGVGRVAGLEVKVPLSLPGERVVATVERRGRDEVRARLDRVLKASPDRAASRCPHAGTCLSCPLIHMAYGAQLRFKAERIRSALARYGGLNGVAGRGVWGADETFGYRATAKLAVARGRSGVIVGMYAPGTRQVVDATSCPVHHPLINAVAAALRDEVRQQRVPVLEPGSGRGLLRFVVVRVSPARRTAMVTLVVTRRDLAELTRLAKGLVARLAEIVGVHASVNVSDSGMVLGQGTFRVLGAPDLFDLLGDVRLKISPSAFFQVNHSQAARIYAQVRTWAGLTAAECALDLYCGIGGIAMHLAHDARHVLGIDIVPGAIRDARANAAANGISNCTFRAGNALGLLRETFGRTGAPAVAVVNPPRSGCEPGVLSALAALRPRMLAYVSCSPDTLARDLDVLAGMGYVTAELQGVDMFPQTAHVECVARLAPSGRGGEARSS